MPRWQGVSKYLRYFRIEQLRLRAALLSLSIVEAFISLCSASMSRGFLSLYPGCFAVSCLCQRFKIYLALKRRRRSVWRFRMVRPPATSLQAEHSFVIRRTKAALASGVILDQLSVVEMQRRFATVDDQASLTSVQRFSLVPTYTKPSHFPVRSTLGTR